VIVVDAMVMMDLLLSAPARGPAADVLEADPQWAVPLLWRSEVANVLATRIRHGERTLDFAQGCLSTALKVVEGREYPVSHDRVLVNCAASRCTAYDCEYVVLAQTLDVLLVTRDRQVLDAYPLTAITPEGFLRRVR
jgi:predicted nucleic acid-binding protein